MRTPWLVVGTLIGVVGFVLTMPDRLLPTPTFAVASFWMVVGLAIGLVLDRTKRESRVNLEAVFTRHLSVGEVVLTVVIILIVLGWFTLSVPQSPR